MRLLTQAWILIAAALPCAAIEIATGKMLGEGYDARSFYVREGAGAWQKTYSGKQFRPEAAGRLMNLRIAQALFHDEWMTEVPFDPEKHTDRFVQALDTYKAHGILTISISLQGGNPAYERFDKIRRDRPYKLGPGKGSLISAFRPDGSLKEAWMKRALKLQRELDRRGMVLELMYYYQHQDEVLKDTAAIDQGVRNVTDWLIDNNCRNVIIHIANEHDVNSYDHDRYIHRNIGKLMDLARSRFAAKKAGFRLPVSASTGGGTAAAPMPVYDGVRDRADLVMIHGNNKTPEAKRARAAQLVADTRMPGPIYMNEDNNGRETTVANLALELESCDALFKAGGSWGYMPWVQLQIFPFRHVMPASNSTVSDEMPVEQRDPAYFKAVLEHIQKLVVAQASLPSRSVGRWDRFEAAVTNATHYADPYGDVTLNVAYTSPSGRQTGFWGFHDGGNTWKFRFMPDEAGVWRYSAKFSDGAPGVEGSFQCVASDLPGMLSVYAANPLWFGYRGGGRAMIRSLHVGDRFFASNWPDGKRAEFLDWVKRNGYNTLSIASHYLNRDDEGRGRGWQTPNLWPLNAEEYRKMEKILDDLAARRILVYPFAGFFGQKSNYPRGHADQERYIRYTLARIGSYWNLFFNVAGPEPNLNRRWMEDEDVIRLGKLIAKLDVFGHPLSVHNRTGDDPFRDSSFTTYGTLQGPKTVNRKKLSQGLLDSHHPRKPLYAQETLWTNNKFHKEPYSEVDVRKNAYTIHMSAAMLNYGDMDGDSSSGFTGTLELGRRKQTLHDAVRKVWDFFESVPFETMSPHQDLVDNGFCLADPGRRYLVYLETNGSVNVSVTGGPYKVEWIDAQNTRDVRAGGQTKDGRGLETPDEGDDWLLQLTR
ncbi:MAG: DUF5060 domain-containing protein [Bryobacteraceae bacterium]